MRLLRWALTASSLLAAATAVRADDVDRLVKQLQGPDVLAAQDAADALGRMGPRAEAAVPALAAALRQPALGRPAAFALAHIGGKGTALLIATLNDGEATNRWLAGMALHSAGRAAVPALAEELRADDPDRREKAAGVLNEIGPEAADAVPALAATLEDRRPSFTFQGAENRGDEASDFVWSVGDSLEPSRRSAAFALARMGPEGEAVLAAAVQDPSFPPRWQGVLALLEDLRRDKVFIYSLKYLSQDRRRALGQLPGILHQDLADLRPRWEVLRPHDRLERWLAAEALASTGHAPPTRALSALRQMLHEPDAASRIAAADALKLYGPDAVEAVPDLLALLDDPRYDGRFPGDIVFLGGSGFPQYRGVRKAATEALLAAGPEAEARLLREGVPRLIRGLKDEDGLFRAHAAVALSVLGPKAGAAAPALVEAYKNAGTTEWKTLEEALRSVGADSAPPLLRLFQDKEIRKQWKGEGGDDVWPPSEYIFAILSDLGPQAKAVIPDLLTLTKDEIPGVREGAIDALLRIDPDGKTTLQAALAALHDPDAAVRRKAARVSARLDAPPKLAFPILRKLLMDPDAGVASDAAYALVRLGDDPHAPATRLVALLGADPVTDPALAVLCDLGRRAKTAAPALVRRMEGADPLGRVKAADALCVVAPHEAKTAIPVLLAILEDPTADKACRTYSLQVLLRTSPPDKAEAPKVLELLDDPAFQEANRFPQDDLIQLLERMKADPAILLKAYRKVHGSDFTPDSLLDTKERVRRLMIDLRAAAGAQPWAPAQSLGEIGKPAEAAVPRLKESLEDPSTRSWSAYALLRITDDDEVYLPLLIKAVRNDPNASYALGELGPRAKTAIPTLVEALDDPSDDVRTAAAYALGKMGPDARSAVPSLTRLLTGKSSGLNFDGLDTRYLIVAALGDIGPAARDAIPVLGALADDQDEMLASAAKKALEQIRASDDQP